MEKFGKTAQRKQARVRAQEYRPGPRRPEQKESTAVVFSPPLSAPPLPPSSQAAARPSAPAHHAASRPPLIGPPNLQLASTSTSTSTSSASASASKP
uniref:Uncharacterized protein n=1 Tax=Oryza nivara TaxID=4536 RepID=A0A0E0H6Z6_ORYNI